MRIDVASRWLRLLIRLWVLPVVMFGLHASSAEPSAQRSGLDTNGVWWVDSTAEQQSMHSAARWCLDVTETLEVQAIDHGACPWQTAQGKDLSQGLKPGAMWLRLPLGNASPQPLIQWLVVGHPQLQNVSLWTQTTDAAGAVAWQSLHTGTAIAVDHRPVPATYAVLALTLASQTVQTVYVRVTSQTALDATTTLWRPAAYQARQGRLDLLHAVALGGLLLAALFGLLLAGLMRDRTSLYFGLGMLGELVLEGVRSGLLALHVWPSNQPFWVGTVAVGSLVGTVFLCLFLLEFLGAPLRRQWLATLFKASVMVYVLGNFWAMAVDLRQGLWIWIWALQALMLLGLALIASRYREGQKQVWYLALAFAPVIVTELLRFFVAYGWFRLDASFMVAGPWGLIFVTPLLLLALVRRSRDLYTELIRSQAESQARVGFLAQMSHELRAPLTTVQGYAQLLQRQSSRVRVPDAAAAISRAGQRLLDMTEEVLDFARGQADSLRLDLIPVHWPHLMQDLELHAQALSQQHRHPFLMQQSWQSELAEMSPAMVNLWLDERRLRQVLDNLLSNAFRYCNGSQVRLTCRAQAVSKHSVKLCFEVADDGPGMDLDEQAHIFKPFTRGSAGQNHQGVGLGLAIASQMTKLMGASLDVLSAPGAGSVFTLALTCSVDLAPERQRQSSLANVSISLGQQRHILVVDDDAEALKVLTLLLKDNGFVVSQAEGAHAAQALLGPAVDLVLTDQIMAKGNGWELLQMVRQQRRHVPVVLLSAGAPVRPTLFSQTLAFDAVMLKPFNASALLTCLAQLLALQISYVAHPDDKRENKADPMTRRVGAIPLLSTLRELIAQGAVTEIIRWSEMIANEQPEAAAFAGEIGQAALTMNFEALHRLVDAATNEPSA